MAPTGMRWSERIWYASSTMPKGQRPLWSKGHFRAGATTTSQRRNRHVIVERDLRVGSDVDGR